MEKLLKNTMREFLQKINMYKPLKKPCILTRANIISPNYFIISTGPPISPGALTSKFSPSTVSQTNNHHRPQPRSNSITIDATCNARVSTSKENLALE